MSRSDVELATDLAQYVRQAALDRIVMYGWIHEVIADSIDGESLLALLVDEVADESVKTAWGVEQIAEAVAVLYVNCYVSE